MSWYKTGSVSVTANSGVVNGTSTKWKNYAKAGDALLIDGLMYEVESIDSDIQLTLNGVYKGSSGSMKSYALIPVSALWGETSSLIDKVSEQVEAVRDILNGTAVNASAGAIVQADGEGKLTGWTDSLRRATELEAGTVKLSDVMLPSDMEDYPMLEEGKISEEVLPDNVMTSSANELPMATAPDIFDDLTNGTVIASKITSKIFEGSCDRYCILQIKGESGKTELAMGVEGHEMWIRHKSSDDAAWSEWRKVSVGDSNDEAMTGEGQLNVKLTGMAKKNSYENDGLCAVDVNDSDVININGLYFGDVSEKQSEGLNWYRDSSHWDSLRAYQGHLYFCPNRANDVHSGTEQHELLTTASSVTGTSMGVLSIEGDTHNLITQAIGTVAFVGNKGAGSVNLPQTGNGVSVLVGKSNSAPTAQTEGFWLYGTSGSKPDAWIGTRPLASDSEITWRHVAFTDSDITGSAASAGAFTCSELIENTNLNDVRTVGLYRCSLTSTAMTMSNLPVQEAFGLEVKPSGPEGAVMQTLVGYSTSAAGIHYRTFYNGTWSAWAEIPDTNGEWTGTLKSDSEYPLVKKAVNVNLSTQSAASRKDCAVLVMNNSEDTVHTNGGIMKLEALQPASSNDMFAGIVLDNPRGGNLPTDPLTTVTGACYTGIGVYYEYNTNKAYPSAHSAALPSVNDNSEKLATTQWVQNRLKTAENRIQSLEKRLLDYEATIASLKSRLDALEATE